MSRQKSKIKVYLNRYLLPELAGTAIAVLCSTIVYYFSGNTILTALAGTWGENLGFYGVIVIREVSNSKKYHRETNQKYSYLSFAKNMRNIFLEFGTSEILDTFFLRPATMYFFTTIIPNVQLGILVGKIVADIIFYIPAIIAYELQKKYFKDR